MADDATENEDDRECPGASDSLPPLSAKWLAEIKDRSAELDAGKVQGIPWEQVRDAALKRLELQRAGKLC